MLDGKTEIFVPAQVRNVFAGFPVMRLSIATTRCPSARSRSVRMRPQKTCPTRYDWKLAAPCSAVSNFVRHLSRRSPAAAARTADVPLFSLILSFLACHAVVPRPRDEGGFLIRRRAVCERFSSVRSPAFAGSPPSMKIPSCSQPPDALLPRSLVCLVPKVAAAFGNGNARPLAPSHAFRLVAPCRET